jgi:hypothetical protein
MKFNEFKIARKIILEHKESDIEESIYEFIAYKYENELNEGILSSVVSWFKRNFSPTAVKLKSLASEYYKWLTNEFTATYKGGDDETSLERFYKTEKVSDDIEDKILKTAGDDESYRKLAEELILEYKIRAKKDFSTNILGAGNNLTKEFERELGSSSERVNDIMNELSREDVTKFKKNLNDLKLYIKKQGKWSDRQAGVLASGIMTFAQNRKNANYTEFSPIDLQREYDKGESPWFSVNSNMKNSKGVEYCFSIRALSGDASLMQKNKLLGKDIADQVNKIIVSLKSVGVDPAKEEEWGYVELYLKQLTVNERINILAQIKSSIKDKSDEQKALQAEEISTALEKTAEDETLDQVNATINDAEKILSRPTQEKPTEKPESTETEASETKPTENKPDEEIKSVDTSSIVNRLKETQKTIVFDPLKDIIFTIGSAIKDDRGKFVFNNEIKTKKTETAMKIPVDPDKIGIPAEYVEQAKKYIKSVKEGDILNSKLNEKLINVAAKSLLQDIENIAKLSDDNMKEIMNLSDNDFKFFVLRLLNDKKLSDQPVPTDKIKEVFKDTLTHYGL